MLTQPATFMQACLDYFGKQPGQTNIQFAGEIKNLTPEDRQEVAAGLKQNGYTLKDVV